jgi:hypothetical protein
MVLVLSHSTYSCSCKILSGFSGTAPDWRTFIKGLSRAVNAYNQQQAHYNHPGLEIESLIQGEAISTQKPAVDALIKFGFSVIGPITYPKYSHQAYGIQIAVPDFLKKLEGYEREILAEEDAEKAKQAVVKEAEALAAQVPRPKLKKRVSKFRERQLDDDIPF